MTFNVLNQFKPYNETTITGRHGSSNVVAPQCVCRCGLRVAFVAFECRRMSSLCSARAAVGCVLPCRTQCRRMWSPCSARAAVGCVLPSAVRTQLWAAHCLCRIRVCSARRCGLRVAILIPNVVDPQCVRSCGLRIAFVASACPRTSLPRSVYAAVGCALPSMHPNAQEFRRIRTPNKFCSARAAVGRALLSSHRRTEPRSCLAARTPLRAVCCFRRIRHPLASGASSWLRGSRWRVFGQSSNSDVTLQSYYYQDGFLQQQDAEHPSAGETRRAVGPNHARWLSSITNSCGRCATFST